MRKIQIHLSKQDQTEMGYENPSIEHDVDLLLGKSFDFNDISKRKKDILKVVRKDLNISNRHLLLSKYVVEEFNKDIHIYPRKPK